MRRLLAIAALTVACTAAFLVAGASTPGSGATTYKVIFDNAFGLVEGGDFRVGGVTAGQTKSFEVKQGRGGREYAEVTVSVTETGFGDFRKDATCDIKPQSLIGEYFVDCQTGSSPQKLPKDGSRVVPPEQTSSTIPQDLVNNILRRPTRERLRLIISSLGAGLAGRPADLQKVLRKAHPGLRETTKVLGILGDQNQTIERFIADSDRVIGELAENKQDVVRWVRETGETAEISATRRGDIQRGFERLDDFLGELRPTMARLEDLTDAQTPLLADLETAAPDLREFFTRLGPFAQASRPAISSLGRSARVGSRAFLRGRQEIDELRRLAPDVPGASKPLRQFLQTLDDRRRAIEVDPRAKKSAPPAPDKTAIPGKGGFTGFETFWNYFFWQTLSLNGFDKFSHVLRVGLTAREEEGCVEYINERTGHEDTLRACNQWLGPYQPGIVQRDFTDGSAPSSAARRGRERPAARAGERRSPGQPDAGPLPGQRDISKPQITLPPDLQQLLDRLPNVGSRTPEALDGIRRRAGGLGSRGGADATQDAQLLDYLLAP
jgi:ABC-type transporter Mla subunit MlaD